MNTGLWIKKHEPTKLSEFIGNESAKRTLVDWLDNYYNGKKIKVNPPKSKKKKPTPSYIYEYVPSTALVTGEHGVGKSILVELAVKHCGFIMKKIKLSDSKDTKSMEKFIKSVMNGNNILDKLQNESNKYVLVIDEMETIISNVEKKLLKELQKMNNEKRSHPIIFISTNHHSKLLVSLKKFAQPINVYSPYQETMVKITNKICEAEKLTFVSNESKNKIITHSQSDIRRLIYTLQDLNYACNKNRITIEDVKEYLSSSKNKDEDKGLFNASEQLFFEKHSIHDSLSFYDMEKTLIPLMIQENYIGVILNNAKSYESAFDTITGIADCLSIGDNVENYIFEDQNWDLQDMKGFYACSYSSMKINESYGDSYIRKVGLKFPADLNKTSTQKINKKNFPKLPLTMSNIDIYGYVAINKIIRKMIEENKFEETCDLFKDYKATLIHIDTILKINKLEKFKSLTQRQRKEFCKYIPLGTISK